MLEILVPPIERIGVREKRDITGDLKVMELTFSTVIFISCMAETAMQTPASTLTSMVTYATVIRTMPVLSHVIVKLPFVEDWSEPKST